MVAKKIDRPQLRLIQGGPEVEIPAPEAKLSEPTPPKSEMGRQLSSFADDLDKQIQAWLNL